MLASSGNRGKVAEGSTITGQGSIVSIRKNESQLERLKNRNFHHEGDIYTDFNQKDAPKPYHLTLFHEISHGFSFSKNFSGRKDEWFKYQKIVDTEGRVTKDEIYAVLMENLLKFEQGYKARTHYHTGKVIQKSGKVPGGDIIYTPTAVAKELLDRYMNTNPIP
ncbi:hypothetical protein GCM10011418_25830 [Sphingobacterium alkalisoli]|nr:hypothetical protein GCM10011418_25830 [Sphingobacterium alkalisoli]